MRRKRSDRSERFHFIENTPVSPLTIFNLIYQGFVKQSKLIFTMLFIAGGVQMIVDTEAIHALMRSLATKFNKTPRITIIVMMIAFGIMSVPIQMNYFIPFSSIVLMLCLMMGYDALTCRARDHHRFQLRKYLRYVKYQYDRNRQRNGRASCSIMEWASAGSVLSA